MDTLARTLVYAGLGLVALGGLVWLLGRVGLPIGDLPGDVSWQSESGRTQVHFPLVTMLIVSLVLTVVVNVVLRLFR